ncbi:hypothetical protein pb186bvf_018817 [Paramecium bursaria]
MNQLDSDVAKLLYCIYILKERSLISETRKNQLKGIHLFIHKFSELLINNDEKITNLLHLARKSNEKQILEQLLNISDNRIETINKFESEEESASIRSTRTLKPKIFIKTSNSALKGEFRQALSQRSQRQRCQTQQAADI